MIVGTTLFRLDGNPYYSPEFARGGLAATFVVDVTHVVLNGGNTLTISVEHRNADETTWATAGTFSTISAVGTVMKDITGLEEIIRLKFVYTGATETDAVHFLVQAPSFRPYA